MTWFQRLTLGQKFLSIFAFLLLLLGLSLAAVLFYLSRINSYVERHNRITVPAMSAAADMRHHLYEMSSHAHALFEEVNSRDRQEMMRELLRHEAELNNELQDYRSKHPARKHPILYDMLIKHGRVDLADQEDRALREITDHLEELETRWSQMFDQFSQGFASQARATLDQADLLTRRLTEATTTLIEVQDKINDEMTAEGDSLLLQAKLVILGLVFSLGMMIIAAYVGVSKQIAAPLRSLANTANRVAHNDLNAEFTSWLAKDEVGDLARSLHTMLENIRERTVALQQKTRGLESFTYSVAHDLKSPLREIEGFSSLLERKHAGAMDSSAQRYISVIHASALRMTALIEDLLRYSRIELQSLPKSPVNLRDLVQEILAQRLDSTSGVHPLITVDLPYMMVTGEPTSIRQALVNLIDNAIKYSRASTPSEVSIGGIAAPTERILWVRDNGIGIEPDQTTRIFGLFERLHSAEEYEGTGVGLAIVKLVMDKHRGRAWAESAPGKGSTFYLAFPHSEPS